MLRSLLVLALALAPAAVTAGCTGAAKTEVELVRPLVLTPVDDSKGALKRAAEAVRADPQSGLEVESREVAGVDGGPAVQENSRQVPRNMSSRTTSAPTPSSLHLPIRSSATSACATARAGPTGVCTASAPVASLCASWRPPT
ncbi:hypothetical protein [Nannocystis pusilla]|uniref:hypothetical protein n=1 Tax=Nannocystis pusilla TaxID=889268 RepID=UPI003B7DE8DD